MRAREHHSEIVKRVPRLQFTFVVCIVVIAAAYWVVQVVNGATYRELALNNSLRKHVIEAPRGLIFERNDQPLVENVASYNLLLHAGRSRDLAASRAFAESVLGELSEAMKKRWERPRGVTLIAEDLSLAEVARFEAMLLEHPEFEIDAGHLRLYRHGAQTAHVVGYLSEASEARLASSDGALTRGDLIGVVGVEAAYDGELRGVDGERRVVVDHRGRVKREHSRTPAEAGEELALEIDLEMQQAVARYLEDSVGAVVAMNPKTGGILTMVSSPSYDPNIFTRRLASEDWLGILKAPHDPLQNRTVQNTYSPGSVFKIVVATAGLMEKEITPADSVYCGGATRIYNHQFRCWKREGHGRVRLREAIRDSCDVYFYHLGQRLGIETIARYSRMFGLGSLTGLEISGEKAGLVPGEAWSVATRGTPWYAGETISVSIGQGPLLVTPVQIASLMAIVANGGTRVTPRLVSGAPQAGGTGIDPEALEIVRDALSAVVNDNGTGYASRMPNLEVAGKTATVQVVEQITWTDAEDLPYERRDHAWFASFAPVDDPQLVVVVFVEHGGHGSQAAAPLAKLMYETYFGTS